MLKENWGGIIIYAQPSILSYHKIQETSKNTFKYDVIHEFVKDKSPLKKIEEVKKDVPEKIKIDPEDVKLVEVSDKRRIPWFAGCEYQCQVEKCGEMFFYNQDLRTHIKKIHENLGIDGYLDKYEKFETK